MRKFIYVLVSILVLIMSWESSLEASSFIPQESIRLRILANSDSPQDQWIKRKVRDAIIAEVNSWVEEIEISGLDSAREVITSRLPELERAVADTLKKYGFIYDFQVELGEVSFPTKIYGQKVYPAGDYEALRITLGTGEGKNWWCVLFPPLCFVDIATADYEDRVETGEILEEQNIKEEKSKENEPKVTFGFFFIELWNSWFG